MTPLHVASYEGRCEAVEKLLERGYGAETIYGNGLRLEPLESVSHVARCSAYLGSARLEAHRSTSPFYFPDASSVRCGLETMTNAKDLFLAHPLFTHL